MYGEASIETIGMNWAVKCAVTLHSCISVTDEVKIKEQNKSIAKGPLYVYNEFEAIWMLLLEDVAVLNHMGYWTL